MGTDTQPTVPGIMGLLCLGGSDTIDGALKKLDDSSLTHMALFVRNSEGTPLGGAIFVQSPDLAAHIEKAMAEWESENTQGFVEEEE